MIMGLADTMLHPMFGKIGADRSLPSAKLSVPPATITVTAHHWLTRAYPREINTIADDLRPAEPLRGTTAPHVENLSRSGLSMVLDHSANIVPNAARKRGITDRSDALRVRLT